MSIRIRAHVWSGAVLVAGALLGASREGGAQQRPKEVTDRAIARGRTLYVTKGECAGCHGELGQGTELGEPLTTGTWKLGDGSYAWVLHVVRHSGIAARGRDGDPMPMRGPTLLSDREVRSVAAYVWSISRQRRPKGAS